MYQFFALVPDNLSFLIGNKRIPKKQLNVLRQSFEEQSPQIKSFQHTLNHILYCIPTFNTMKKKKTNHCIYTITSWRTNNDMVFRWKNPEANP
ncbi:YxiJ family protein [Bacillus sp. CNPSo 3703]|nr:YxiJ family protein [Bacillus altitudinis]MDE0640667.1 YxiJ family protein [Bacillus altitudinis]